MEPFTILKGIAAPYMRENVNTDLIIRVNRLLSLPRDALGPWAFEAARYHEDGTENPDFVLNKPAYRSASIMLGGPNFGCGSSREHAVWALWAFGIRAVVAPSFGDIFYSNCFQVGVLPVELPLDIVTELAAAAEELGAVGEFTVDLETQTLTSPTGRTFDFVTPPYHRTSLLKGLDSIGTTLLHEQEIAAFQNRDRAARPWVYRQENA